MAYSVTPTNVIHGAGLLYMAAFGASEPTRAEVSGTIETSSASASWTQLGATEGGVTVAVAQTYVEIRADQVPEIVERRLTTRDYTVNTTLQEGTFANLKLLLNNAVTTASAGGYDSLEPDSSTAASQPTYIALAVDGHAPNYKTARFFVRKAINTSGFEEAMAREDRTVWTASWGANYVSSSIAPFRVDYQK